MDLQSALWEHIYSQFNSQYNAHFAHCFVLCSCSLCCTICLVSINYHAVLCTHPKQNTYLVKLVRPTLTSNEHHPDWTASREIFHTRTSVCALKSKPFCTRTDSRALYSHMWRFWSVIYDKYIYIYDLP